MAITEHLREGSHLVLAATNFAGLLKVALSAGIFDHIFAFELLFEATDRAINWLILADIDFDRHV